MIGIDGNEANASSRVGIGQYAYHLLRHLYICEEKKSNPQSYTVYLKNPPSTILPKPSVFWNYSVLGPSPLWTQVALPLKLFFSSYKPDIFFSPSHYAPRFSTISQVISIMDLSFLKFPETFAKKDLYQLTNWTSYSISKAKKILTISQFSKDAICQNYSIEPERVVVTHPGYDTSLYNTSLEQSKKIEGIKKKYGIQGKFILFVGTIQPRKNINRLIEAFERVSVSQKVSLVLIGKKGWLYDGIFQRIKESPIHSKIHWLDYVKEEELAIFYKGAECLVLASLYEGFGIPVIEAMACGCPTVVSNTTSLPEVAGDSSVLVDPFSVTSITEGIKMVLEKQSLHDTIRKKGLQNVKRFSWTSCAEQTRKTLLSVIH